MTLEEAIKELYNWRHTDRADWFTAMLFNMFGKADTENHCRLAIGFPSEAMAWQLWQEASNEEQFFKEHGLGK